MRPRLALCLVALCMLAIPARGEATAPAPAPPAEAAPTEQPPAPQLPAPRRVPGHPAFYPSESQISAWMASGRNAFMFDTAHDDMWSVPGVSRWFWVADDPLPVGDAAALVGVSCETPQLLATYAAWRGTRTALPETRLTDAVYARLAEQGGYVRFIVTGLLKSPGDRLGLDYVLNTGGNRYGQPRVSSLRTGVLEAAPQESVTLSYTYESLEVLEHVGVDYAVSINGTTHARAEILSAVGYRRVTVAAEEPRQTPYRYFVTDVVDFPLLRDDGGPTIPAGIDQVTLEVLSADAHREATVNIAADATYLSNDPPMTDPLQSVTCRTLLGGDASDPAAPAIPHAKPASLAVRSDLRAALEGLAKRPEYAGWILKISQPDPKIPTVSITVQPGRTGLETRKALKALVLEGQKACEEGTLIVVLDEGGRKTFQGEYRKSSQSVLVTPVP